MEPTKLKLPAKSGSTSGGKAIEKKERKPVGLMILVIILTLIIGGGVLGYGAYYYAYKKESKDKLELQRQVDSLKSRLTKLKKDLKTWQEREKEICPIALTDEEKATIEGWKTYTNNHYRFTFRYPVSFRLTTNEDDRLSMVSNEDGATFEFLSRDSSVRGYEGYKTISEKSIQIDCVRSTRVYIKGDRNWGGDVNSRIIYAQFTKSNIPHLIVLSFVTRGASFDSDMVELFELIAKTIDFK